LGCKYNKKLVSQPPKPPGRELHPNWALSVLGACLSALRGMPNNCKGSNILGPSDLLSRKFWICVFGEPRRVFSNFKLLVTDLNRLTRLLRHCTTRQ
jgi:hypothetical protein